MTKGLSGEDVLNMAIFEDTENSGAKQVGSSLSGERVAGFGPRNELQLSIVAQAGDMVVGGLNGSTHWGWCYIRQLWVHADWRRRGLGHRLMAETEALARARNCTGLYVDTFDPGAASFYERAGFERCGPLLDYPDTPWSVFYRKRLELETGSA